MRIKMLLKRQDGVALVFVMIIFMVIALLGAAVAASSMGEVKQSVALDKDMRAYYQARSAADSTTHWIKNELLDLYNIELAYIRLEEALDKINAALDAGTLDSAVLDEFAVGYGYTEDDEVTNLAALGDAVGKYDDEADLRDQTRVLDEIAYFLDVITYMPEAGSLDPAVEAELNGYLSTAQAACSNVQSTHLAKEIAFEKVVKPSVGEINSASVSSSGNDVITGVQGVEVQRQDIDGVDYIYTRATAEVYGVSSSAVVRLNETELGDIAGLFTDAIYAAYDVRGIAGNSFEINGHVSYGHECEDINHPDNISTGPDPNGGNVYPDWNPPQKDLTLQEEWPAGGNESHSVPLTAGLYEGISEADGYYSIDASDGDVILHIEKLDMSEPSTITVEGSGNVYLFIDAINEPDKKIKLNVDCTSDAYVYLIFDETVGYVNWTGDCTIEAFIYAPNAKVDIGGGTDITGAIITNNYISSNGNFSVTYRPCNIDLDDFFDNSENGKGKQWLKEEQWPKPEE